MRQQNSNMATVSLASAFVVWLVGSILLVASMADDEESRTHTKSPRFRFNIPKEEVFYDTKVIPEDHQVSAFLYKGETKLFFFLNERREGPLSITVTPCTSSLLWTVRYRPQQDLSEDGRSSPAEEETLETYRGKEIHTFSLDRARVGLYIIEMQPLERETYVHFYATLAGHTLLRQPLKPRIRIQKRQRRKRLTVRWEPSSIDPHLMQYCLVVNTRRDYSTLCEARGERYGVVPPDVSQTTGFDFPRERVDIHKSEIASKFVKINSSRKLQEDIVVGCVGKKTHFTISDLEQGKVYHFNLFAVNKRTNLSFPYAQTTLKYDQKTRPSSLRDGKPATVNLRQQDGRAIFKFKVSKMVDELLFSVMPCGGAVNVDVTKQKATVVGKRRVEGYEKLKVFAPEKGRYVLRVSAVDQEELRRIVGVEVVATTKAGRFPLPDLPNETKVIEYESLRTCDSVTVGWIPSPSPRVKEYCIYVREEKRQKRLYFKKPNQCNLDKNLRRDANFVVMHCVPQNPADTRLVVTQKLSSLKAGKSYIVQVTVKKTHGKSLSYDLLQVYTKSSCV